MLVEFQQAGVFLRQTRLHQLDFPADGLVIKVDSTEQRELLGRTSKSPRWMIAYKVASESCISMQKRNSQEMEDLSRMLKSATEPLATQQQSAPKQAPQAPVQKPVPATA
jgi:hypothetical protein